jgi:UDP-N-acetylmuramoyl-L-alanyl-D-glutamate--2,6-diaminopimelate ligase
VSVVSQWLLDHATSGADLVSDSRRVRKGDVFVAYPGQTHDGRAYIDQALAAGAAALIVEADGFDAAGRHFDVPVLQVSQLKRSAGEIASAYYGHPTHKLAVIGVTGTSGKTTTTQWIAHTLTRAGLKCGVIGTLGAGFVGRLQDFGLTTPQSVDLQRTFAQLVREGAQAVAIEASSIGLVEHRLAGTRFHTAVFTNLTQDHLDYHGTMEAYEAAKRVLFTWPGLKAAVTNLDDAAGQRVAKLIASQANVPHLVGFGLQRHDGFVCDIELFVRDLNWTAAGAELAMTDGETEIPARLPAFGVFNVSNALAVTGAMLSLGIPLANGAQLLSDVPLVDGRLMSFGGSGQPLVIVDYAHKPDALDKVLQAMQPVARARGGKLVCVFGCGGDRDASKRPIMGAIAARLSDRLVITSDNPRSEDPLTIMAQIEAGLPGGSAASAGIPVILQSDRAQAIAGSIAQANALDVIVVAGKGHETYQEVRGVKHPFEDAAHVKAALTVRGGAR